MTEFVLDVRDPVSSLTPRTRFVAWLGADQAMDLIDDCLSVFWDKYGEDIHDSDVIDLFPPLLRASRQSREWWEQFLAGGRRITDALRAGVGCEPVTTGEEVFLNLVLKPGGFAESARHDFIPDVPEWRTELATLPAGEDDYDFREVLAELCGDGDVEQLWWMEFDGVAESELGAEMGMRDYRLSAWNTPYA